MPRANVGDIDRIQQVTPTFSTLNNVQRTGDGARREQPQEHEKPKQEDQVELTNEVEHEEVVASRVEESESSLDLTA